MDDSDTKRHLLELANNFFMDFGIHFKIKPLTHHRVTQDKVYSLQSNKCDIYILRCALENIFTLII